MLLKKIQQNCLNELGINPIAFTECPDDYPETFFNELINSIEHFKRFDDPVSQLLKILFYFENTDHKITCFQFVLNNDQLPTKTISFGPSSKLSWVQTTIDSQKTLSQLRFRHIGDWIDQKSSLLEQLQQLTIGSYELKLPDPNIKSSKDQLSEIENILIANHEEIKAKVSEKGFWHLPENVKNQHHVLQKIQDPVMDVVISEKAAEFFAKSSLIDPRKFPIKKRLQLLDKF